MNCPKCKKSLGCGCQKRVASDGTQGCSSCIPIYEIEINKKKEGQNNLQHEFIAPPTLNPNGTTDPVISGLSLTMGTYNNFEK